MQLAASNPGPPETLGAGGVQRLLGTQRLLGLCKCLRRDEEDFRSPEGSHRGSLKGGACSYVPMM